MSEWGGTGHTPFIWPSYDPIKGRGLVKVHIPTALRSFSGGRSEVEVEGNASLRAVFERLDGACPGIRDHLLDEEGITPGIAIFINDEQETEGLIQRVPAEGTIHILPAMGGGSLYDS
jgi:molybdopterin converting factor small subunit